MRSAFRAAPWRPVGALATLLWLVSPSVAAAQSNDDAGGAQPASEGPAAAGPLRISERNPLYHLFLTPMVLEADLMGRGEAWVGSSMAYSNVFEYNSSPVLRQLFDLERLHAAFVFRRGVTDNVEFGAQLGFQHNWHGFLDPLIQGVHTTFGFPNADREKRPNNAYGLRLEGVGEQAATYLDLPAGIALDAPRVFVAWRIAGGRAHTHAVSARTTLKLPLGDARVSTRRSDVAFEIAGRRSWGPNHLHISGGAVVLNSPRMLEPLMQPVAALGSVAYERTVSNSVSLLAQFSGGSAYTRGQGIAELTGAAVNFAVGAAGRFGTWEWQASFAEDVPPNSPSVDFTFDLQLARRWPQRARSAVRDQPATREDDRPGSL
jgi:hypothetical protein